MAEIKLSFRVTRDHRITVAIPQGDDTAETVLAALDNAVQVAFWCLNSGPSAEPIPKVEVGTVVVGRYIQLMALHRADIRPAEWLNPNRETPLEGTPILPVRSVGVPGRIQRVDALRRQGYLDSCDPGPDPACRERDGCHVCAHLPDHRFAHECECGERWWT